MTKTHAKEWAEFIGGSLPLHIAAKLTGLTAEKLSPIRTGRHVPTSETLLALAYGFGLPRSTIARDIAVQIRKRVAKMIEIAGY